MPFACLFICSLCFYVSTRTVCVQHLFQAKHEFYVLHNCLIDFLSIMDIALAIAVCHICLRTAGYTPAVFQHIASDKNRWIIRFQLPPFLPLFRKGVPQVRPWNSASSPAPDPGRRPQPPSPQSSRKRPRSPCAHIPLCSGLRTCR